MYGRQGLLCAHIEHLLAEVAAAIPVLAEAESHTPIIILQILSGVLSILGPGSEGLLGGITESLPSDAGHSPASNRMPPRSSPTQSSRFPYSGVMGLPVRRRLHTSFTEYNLV